MSSSEARGILRLAPGPWASLRRRMATSADARLLLAAPFVAFVTLAVALVATELADVAFRDPDHVAALYVLEVGAGVFLLVGLDILIRARRIEGTWRPSLATMKAVRRERWTARRGVAVAVALVSFYVAYLAYRNLKATVPLLRPDEIFDSQLLALERTIFFGNDPYVLLHQLLGTGIQTHVISTIYIAFIVFLPLSLGIALVFADRLEVSLFYATALSINWIIGAGTYFLLPALGPVFADPSAFAALPDSHVTHLQGMMLEQRIGFLDDPATGTPQAIAAFASLHVAMSFTALLAAYVLDLGRRVKQGLWVWLALTLIATIYLGWHYVVDDVAGLLMGAAALLLAYVITGFDPRSARRPPQATVPAMRG